MSRSSTTGWRAITSAWLALLADLIRRRVAVIATPASHPATLAAKAATSTIPIVFGVGEDPVKLGLVASLARPGGNATGVNSFSFEVDAKRLGLMHELLPKANRFAVLLNPAGASSAEATSKALKEAAPTLGLDIVFFNATTADEIDAAFAAFARARPDALFIAGDGFFASRSVQFATLAARERIPASFSTRVLVEAGLLMCYGPDIVDTFRQVGVYTGSILKGAKPADLPVLQSTKFEFVINRQTAKSLGLEIPPAAARPRRRGDRMRRREFITLLGGAAAWPLAARAQQGERVRRIGIIVGGPAAGDVEGQARIDAFRQAMELLGWTTGRNLQIEYRWGMADPASIRKYAAELVGSAPDVILSSGAASLAQLLQETRTVPIVFVNVADPVGGGFVNSLSRPGGNATGFMSFEYSLSAKWLELLKQIVPAITRAAVLRDAALTLGTGQFAVIQSVASSVGVEVSPINVHDAREIERAIAAFARSPNGGLVMTSSPFMARHRELIIGLAARHKLPAVYPFRTYVTDGGLISYGPDTIEQFRRAAGYVDRILKGEKPADLPVQAPTKYELVINLKTAKALGLEVPPTLLARADEVIE